MSSEKDQILEKWNHNQPTNLRWRERSFVQHDFFIHQKVNGIGRYFIWCVYEVNKVAIMSWKNSSLLNTAFLTCHTRLTLVNDARRVTKLEWIKGLIECWRFNFLRLTWYGIIFTRWEDKTNILNQTFVMTSDFLENWNYR